MGKNNKLWVLIGMLQVLLLLLVACSPAATSSSQPASTNVKSKKLVLSDNLIRNCKAEDYASDKIGLPVGEKAINFTLKDLKGNDVTLSKLLVEKPVLLIFGSFT
jgi:cytochrome oxidase Cu insertion factor (SCO1/SenC/PrrC family)